LDEYMNEQEQWDTVKRWVRENGLWVVAGVAIGVLGLGGWRMWEARVERLAHEASTRYEQVLEAFVRNDRTRALTLIDELRRDYPDSPYADQGELAAARAHVESREFDRAAERLEGVMNGSKDPELRLIARGRLARVRIAQGQYDAALAVLEAAEPGAFAARFAEIRGDALHARGDRAGALAAYRAARETATEGAVDRTLLDLKIAELDAPTAPVVVTPAVSTP
jgi:predicted negative regulator of RcsB-dependent stress response